MSGVFGSVRLGRPGPENATTHPVRAAILQHLKAQQCSSISDLCRRLDISWGVAQHHLYVLRKAQLVRSESRGRTNLFFLQESLPSRVKILAVLQAPRGRGIVQEILTSPGVGQKELCQRLNVSRKVFRHHVDLLVAAGLILENKNGATRNYLATPLSTVLGTPGEDVAPTSSPATFAPAGPGGPAANR